MSILIVENEDAPHYSGQVGPEDQAGTTLKGTFYCSGPLKPCIEAFWCDYYHGINFRRQGRNEVEERTIQMADG